MPIPEMKTIFIIVTLIIVTALLIIPYAIGSLLSAPQQHTIGSAPTDLPIETITITTQRGNELSAWFIAGDMSKGVVLLMHGVRSTRLQMVDRAKFLHQVGFSVLLFDFQAHGESLGEYITFGHREAYDASAAYDYIKQRLPNEKVAIIGVSLGGASALLSPIATQVDALVLEAVYSDLETAIGNRLSIRMGQIGRMLTPLLSWQIEPRLGFKPSELAPIQQIAKVTAPVLIIAGAKDEHTLLDESKQFYMLANEPKELWVLPEVSHVDFYQHDPDEYQQRVLKFLSESL